MKQSSRIVFALAVLAWGMAGAAPRVRVVAHRGDHTAAPENTIAAYRAAIAAGADYFEVDVRTAPDGRLVLSHGPEFDEKSAPEFAAALAVAKDRCGVYVDIKAAATADLIREIGKAKMGDNVVLYGSPSQLAEIRALRPRWKVMPEAATMENLERVMAALQPAVVAFDARDFKDDLIARAKRGGALVFVDRLGLADNPQSWHDAVERGADGIQTDRPGELVRWLKERGLH